MSMEETRKGVQEEAKDIKTSGIKKKEVHCENRSVVLPVSYAQSDEIKHQNKYLKTVVDNFHELGTIILPLRFPI